MPPLSLQSPEGPSMAFECPGCNTAPSALKVIFDGSLVSIKGSLSTNLVNHGASSVKLISAPYTLLLIGSSPKFTFRV